ncbi:4Fe-4S binding protein [Myxococcota bacterium]|nr:4Fe-4S binding protein [Myxococcota bacterium]MBU1380268.1 4Fe-4S binding protein [Myxococcota bacterium]MBU1496381.1 4Fe-4S binding protein [Myxococcota bacterium]
MKVLFLLQSTTGNTAVITEAASRILKLSGIETQIVNIVKHALPESYEEFDALFICSSVMYFRPLIQMEKVLANMPAIEGKPVFALATCAGGPGGFFDIIDDILRNKGTELTGSFYTLAPSNWPLHLHIATKIPGQSIGDFLSLKFPSFRPLLGFPWPGSCTPSIKDADKLEEWVSAAGTFLKSSTSDGVPKVKTSLLMSALGKMTTHSQIEKGMDLFIDHVKCTKCGLCVKNCPAKIIAQNDLKEVPHFKSGCHGCYTCYNICPAAAIGQKYARGPGSQYHGPSPEMKSVFLS